MQLIPLDIIQQRTRACLGESGKAACPHFRAVFKCDKMDDLRSALKYSEEPRCPIGRHLHARDSVPPPRRKMQSRWRYWRNGAMRLMDFLRGRCRPLAEIVKFRRSQCAACPERKRRMGVSMCGKCGCILTAKTAISTEVCPLGRWWAVAVDGCPKPAGRQCGGCQHGR